VHYGPQYLTCEGATFVLYWDLQMDSSGKPINTRINVFSDVFVVASLLYVWAYSASSLRVVAYLVGLVWLIGAEWYIL